jgi:hypothetical protein
LRIGLLPYQQWESHKQPLPQVLTQDHAHTGRIEPQITLMELGMHVFLPVYLLSLVIRQILLLWALQKRLFLARCCSLIEVHKLATCAATAIFWVEPRGFHSLFT